MVQKDLAGQIEDIVSQSVDDLRGIMQEELKGIRPVGSSKVAPDEQMQEWKMMKDRPDVLAKFFADQNASVSSAIKYAHEMGQKENV